MTSVSVVCRLVTFAPMVLATLPVLLAGCPHTDSFDDGVFRKDHIEVHFGPVPAEWTSVRVEGADLAFRDEPHEGSALFDVRCGNRDDDAPLGVLTEHLVMGTTERNFDRQDVIPFDRREAMHSVMHAKLDGVAMQYDIYVLKKDGCVYDLVYVAPPGRFTEGSPAFERFAAGLHGSSASGDAP
jgi:hypothetical protein